MVPLAINGGIGFGAKLTHKQLIELVKHLDEDTEVEITTFQQLYIEIPESKLEVTKKELENVGFSRYPVGPYVKSLRICKFSSSGGRGRHAYSDRIKQTYCRAGGTISFTSSIH